MWRLHSMRETVSILMESGCYFNLGLKERHYLVKYLLCPAGPGKTRNEAILAEIGPGGYSPVNGHYDRRKGEVNPEPVMPVRLASAG